MIAAERLERCLRTLEFGPFGAVDQAATEMQREKIKINRSMIATGLRRRGDLGVDSFC